MVGAEETQPVGVCQGSGVKLMMKEKKWQSFCLDINALL